MVQLMATRLLVGVALLLGVSSSLAGQDSPLPPGETHDRLVALITKNATRPIAAGDTFVTWSPTPNLYTTVSRSPGVVQSSLVRADGMVGTATGTWTQGHQTSAIIRWTQGDSVLLETMFAFDGSHLTAAGSLTFSAAPPMIPWVVADYGMEDQVVPLLLALRDSAQPLRIALFRPYAHRWDTTTVRVSQTEGGYLATLVGKDGEIWWYAIAQDGALLRITRSKHPDVERRPLEMSPRFAEYVRRRAMSK